MRAVLPAHHLFDWFIVLFLIIVILLVFFIILVVFIIEVVSRLGRLVGILDPYIKLLDSLLKSCFTLGSFPCFEIPGDDEKLPGSRVSNLSSAALRTMARATGCSE